MLATCPCMLCGVVLKVFSCCSSMRSKFKDCVEEDILKSHAISQLSQRGGFTRFSQPTNLITCAKAKNDLSICCTKGDKAPYTQPANNSMQVQMVLSRGKIGHVVAMS